MEGAIVINFTEGWAWGWSAIQAIATCVLIAGIIVAIIQMRNARKSTNAQIAMQLFKELRLPRRNMPDSVSNSQ